MNRKKIIISGKEQINSPWTAFALSFFITGLGQVYCGSAAKGAVFMLLRFIAVIAVPCHMTMNPGAGVLYETFAAACAFLFITIVCPVESFASAYRSRRIQKHYYNSMPYYAGFSAISILLLVISLFIFFSFFSIYRSQSDHCPVISRGDILLVNRAQREFRNGEAVIINWLPLRIISRPGESASFRENRFVLNGTELARSVYTDEEIRDLAFNCSEVIAEYNGMYRYAVINPAPKSAPDIKTDIKKYFAAGDDRRKPEGFTAAAADEIYGSFEGVLLSPARRTVLIRPSSMADR